MLRGTRKNYTGKMTVPPTQTPTQTPSPSPTQTPTQTPSPSPTQEPPTPTPTTMPSEQHFYKKNPYLVDAAMIMGGIVFMGGMGRMLTYGLREENQAQIVNRETQVMNTINAAQQTLTGQYYR